MNIYISHTLCGDVLELETFHFILLWALERDSLPYKCIDDRKLLPSFFFFHIAYSSLSFSCHFENYLWKVLGLCKLVPYNLTGYGSRIKSYHKSHRIFCFLFYHHSSKLMAGGCVFGCCCQNLALKFLSYFSLY